MFPRKREPQPPDPAPRESAPAAAGAPDAARLEEEVADLRAQLDQALEKWKRALADFQNYQRRSLENEREAHRQGVTAAAMSIVPVLDHFDLALSHPADSPAAVQVIQGVRVIRDELLKALAAHGVTVISPSPGEDLDPTQHQAVVQHPQPGVPPGHVAATLQVGYALGDRVIRPAKVAVAPSEQPEEGEQAPL